MQRSSYLTKEDFDLSRALSYIPAAPILLGPVDSTVSAQSKYKKYKAFLKFFSNLSFILF